LTKIVILTQIFLFLWAIEAVMYMPKKFGDKTRECLMFTRLVSRCRCSQGTLLGAFVFNHSFSGSMEWAEHFWRHNDV